jgi:polyphenol oxidase
MKISRRKFIGTSAVGLVSASTVKSSEKQSKPIELCGPNDAKQFVFGSDPVRVRKSFYDLSEEELINLCKAVEFMRNKTPLESPISWESYTRIHSKHCTAYDADHPQVHWGWHFLPWHRGYIFFLERLLANSLKKMGIDGTKFAFPYWDWTSHPEMPNTKFRESKGLGSPLFGYDLTQQNMVNPDNLGFDNLALYNGNRAPTLEKNKMDPNNETQQDSKDHVQECLAFVSKQYVDLMLTTPWEQFGGKEGIDRKTGQGLLESGAHNDVHDWVGTRYGCNRDMGTLRYAAQDPVFFMHHTNLDRIFSLYKNPMPDLNGPWGQQRYVYPDLDGTPVSVSVKDIMLWTQTVSYQQPQNTKVKLAPRSKISSVESITVPIDKKTTAKSGLNFTLEPNQSLKGLISSAAEGGISLLEIETGPISHKGRAVIKVYVGKTYIGRIKILDGDPSTTNPEASHTFSMTLGKLGNIATALPSINKFDINFFSYGIDNDVLIRNLKFTLIK